MNTTEQSKTKTGRSEPSTSEFWSAWLHEASNCVFMANQAMRHNERQLAQRRVLEAAACLQRWCEENDIEVDAFHKHVDHYANQL